MDLAGEMGARDPAGLADQLQLVMNGAYGSGQLLGPGGPAAATAATAAALIAAQIAEERTAPRNSMSKDAFSIYGIYGSKA